MKGAERMTAVDLLGQGEIWVDSQGTTYKISEMEPRYVHNVRSYLLRNGRALAEQAYHRVAFGMQPSGDMACDAVDAILEELLDAIENPGRWLERSELVQALDARIAPPVPDSPAVSYVDEVKGRLMAVFPKLAEPKRRDLLDFYTLLVLIRGEETTAKHVHDAWAVRMANLRPDHWSLIPYEELPEDRQWKDDKYVRVIREIARSLKGGTG